MTASNQALPTTDMPVCAKPTSATPTHLAGSWSRLSSCD